MDSRVIALVFISVVVGMMGLIAIGGIASAETGCTDENPCEISNVDELQDMSLDGHYVLVDDIDAAGFEFYPIGYDMESGEPDSFSGSLDGQGYVITGLTVRSPESTDYEGDMGMIARNTGDIENLDLVDVDVEGDLRVGAITGWNQAGGGVDNVSVSGLVSGTGSSTGPARTGGLVGLNDGSSNSNANIFSSESSADVTGSGSNVGGLVGVNGEDGTVYNSYASGDVSAADESKVGGLVGSSSGTVTESYAIGEVTGRYEVGGLIGEAGDESVTLDTYSTGNVTAGDEVVGGLIGHVTGTLKWSYATGNVTAESPENGNYGGLVGWSTSGVNDYEDNYWDVESTGQDESDVGTGLTTSEMTGEDAVADMTGFDFESVWMTTESYPELTTNSTGGGGGGGSDSSIGWGFRLLAILLAIMILMSGDELKHPAGGY